MLVLLLVLVLVLLFAASADQSVSAGSEPDPPTWADKLEAWATLGAAFVALAAAAATFWLLIHQIRETRRARKDAAKERVDAAADRELARRDRELVEAERRDAELMQARTVVVQSPYIYRRLDGRTALKAGVWNHGTGPVTEVWAQLLAMKPDAADGHRVWLDIEWVLGPAESMPIDEELDDDEVVVDDAGGWYPEVELEVYFVDMHGRRWVRRPTGQPERVWRWEGKDLPRDGSSPGHPAASS